MSWHGQTASYTRCILTLYLFTGRCVNCSMLNLDVLRVLIEPHNETVGMRLWE